MKKIYNTPAIEDLSVILDSPIMLPVGTSPAYEFDAPARGAYNPNGR